MIGVEIEKLTGRRVVDGHITEGGKFTPQSAGFVARFLETTFGLTSR